MKKIGLIFIITGLLLSACTNQKVNKTEKSLIIEEVKDQMEEEKDWLHVESPEWEDQIIYFIMTDRFNDGDSTNNDQGVGEYNQSKNSHYSGGDLKGIKEKIDYIKDLGATAIWITPPVANQWWDPWVHYSGYHGYWAENFKEVDKHYGTLDDYKDLSRELHKNGMYLIQDIVPNHTGNFIRQRKDKNGKIIFEQNEKTLPVKKPTLYPFNMNNANIENEKNMAIYNFEPQGEKDSELYRQTHELSGLDDINTKNPLVIKTLKDSYNYWIKEIGVDGFRIDTAIYVDHEFWNEFIHSEKENELGVENYAKTLGKEDFYTFSESWVNTKEYSDVGDVETRKYLGTKEKPEAQGILNFPLLDSMRRVIAEGEETAELAYRLKTIMKLYENPYKQLNFIDNHDMNRFLNSAPYIAYKQALMFIMTIPGVPVIYYGTEQQFTTTRASMFKEGFGSNGKDNFDKTNDAYEFIKKLTKLRKENEVLRRGKIEILKESKNNPGVFAYKMSKDNEEIVVIMNTADEPILLDNLDLELEEGTKLELLLGLLKTDKDIYVGKHGKVSFVMQPRAGLIYKITDKIEKSEKSDVYLDMDFFKKEKKIKNFTVEGSVKGADKVEIVIDKMIKTKIRAGVSNEKWKAYIPVENLENGTHEVTAYVKTHKNEYFLSETYEFELENEKIKIGEYSDPIGDDFGRTGKYIYPSHESFHREMDIKNVSFYSIGKNLNIEIEPANKISNYWKPKFGFDHVSYSIYIDVPEKEGIEELPFKNAKTKDEMKWDYMILLGGWTSYLYSSNGAGAKNFGTAIAYAPKISVDYEKNKISVLLSAKALGDLKKLENIKIYIVSWDYDGLESSYRKIKEKEEHYIFGGGQEGSPLIMDETQVIELKK